MCFDVEIKECTDSYRREKLQGYGWLAEVFEFKQDAQTAAVQFLTPFMAVEKLSRKPSWIVTKLCYRAKWFTIHIPDDVLQLEFDKRRDVARRDMESKEHEYMNAKKAFENMEPMAN